MKVFNYIFIIILLIVGISFAILNSELVTLYYYLGQVKLPLSLLLVCGFGIGLLCGILVMSVSLLRAKSAKRQLKKQLKLAEEEVTNLRVIPIKNER